MVEKLMITTGIKWHAISVITPFSTHVLRQIKLKRPAQENFKCVSGFMKQRPPHFGIFRASGYPEMHTQAYNMV